MDLRIFRPVWFSKTGAAALMLFLTAGRAWAEPAPPKQDESSFPLVMKTVEKTPVHHNKNVRGTVYAKILPGWAIKVRGAGRNSRCRQGWFERLGGGFICGKFLKKSDSVKKGSRPEAQKNRISRGRPYRVSKKKSPLFSSAESLRKQKPEVLLRRDSTLMVDRFAEVDGALYGVTRNGDWIDATRIERLPAAQKSLGVDVVSLGSQRLLGIVIDDAARVHTDPKENSPVNRKLDRWTSIVSDEDSPAVLPVEGAFVRLPGGGYVKDSQVARVRFPARPPKVKPDERWIAVDIVEQLLLAFEGSRLVRVIPCSTGVEDNTDPGRYRIRLKRRMQTLRMYQGRVRVEDVPSVMYFHVERGLAIHSAYWHTDFGVRRSHGCVNLPPEDAEWVFDWTLPELRPEDAEVVNWSRDHGTKVLVFRLARSK